MRPPPIPPPPLSVGDEAQAARSLTCSLLASALSHALVQTIARGVFEVIVDQSPLVPEGTLGVQKAREGDSDLSEEETSESDMAWRRAAGKKPPGERLGLGGPAEGRFPHRALGTCWWASH